MGKSIVLAVAVLLLVGMTHSGACADEDAARHALATTAVTPVALNGRCQTNGRHFGSQGTDDSTYTNFSDCTWDVTVQTNTPGAGCVVVDFERFDLETSFDFLTITRSDGTIVFRHSGNPEVFFSGALPAYGAGTSFSYTFHFTSDLSVTRGGVNMVVTGHDGAAGACATPLVYPTDVPPVVDTASIAVSMEEATGNCFYHNVGSFGVAEYDNFERCGWNVTVSDLGADECAYLRLSNFTTENFYDPVRVYRREASGVRELVATFSGSLGTFGGVLPAFDDGNDDLSFTYDIEFGSDASVRSAGVTMGLSFSNNCTTSYWLVPTPTPTPTATPTPTPSPTTTPIPTPTPTPGPLVSMETEWEVEGECYGSRATVGGAPGLLFGSNLGGGQYTNGDDCKWRIDVPPLDDQCVRLDFTALTTEQNFDYVRVYHGHDSIEAVDLVMSYTGAAGTPSLELPRFGDGANGYRIEFHSDSSVVASGMQGTASVVYNCAIPAQRALVVNTTLSQGCYFEAGENLFGSNTAGTSYTNNMDCVWEVAHSAAQCLSVRFTNFNTEDRYDTLTATAPNNGEYQWTGNLGAMVEVVREGGGNAATQVVTTFRFHSDGSVVRSGFQGQFVVSDTCDGVEPGTVIVSPVVHGGDCFTDTTDGSFGSNQPGTQYPTGASCEWQITAADTACPVLHFPNGLNAETSFDGLTLTSNMGSLMLTGAMDSAFTIPLPTGVVTARWRSDSSIVRSGFIAQAGAGLTSCPSGATAVSTSGSCTSGSAFSSAREVCSWRLLALDALTTPSLTTECLIVDLTTADLGPSGLRIDRNRETLAEYTGILEDSGSIPLSLLDSPEYTVHVTNGRAEMGVRVGSGDECKRMPEMTGLVREKEVVLSGACTSNGDWFSSNANGYYDGDSMCMWRVRSSWSSCYELSFSRLETESHFDTVHVYGGPADAPLGAGTVLDSFSGSDAECESHEYYTTGSLTVVFTSDGSIEYSGVEGIIRPVQCGTVSCSGWRSDDDGGSRMSAGGVVGTVFGVLIGVAFIAFFVSRMRTRRLNLGVVMRAPSVAERPPTTTTVTTTTTTAPPPGAGGVAAPPRAVLATRSGMVAAAGPAVVLRPAPGAASTTTTVVSTTVPPGTAPSGSFVVRPVAMPVQ